MFLTKSNPMKLLNFNVTILLLISICMLAVSCHKDNEDEETKPSLTGSVISDVPSFAFVNQKITATASGITYPVSGVNYYWYNSVLIPDTLKGQTIEFTIYDSLTTYAVLTNAKCDGYYTSAYTKSIVAVKAGYGNSLTGFPIPKDSIKDVRDGQWYYYKTIGNLDWFTNNLNWCGAGEGYDKADAAGYIFGRLYSWKDATGGVTASGLGAGPQGVCPEGWSIPTNEDWEDLAKTMNSGKELSYNDNWNGLGEKVMIPAKFNGVTLWPYSANCTPTNEFGWNAISSGYSTNNYESYIGMYNYGAWWSSSEYGSDKVTYRYIYYNQSDFPMNYTNKTGMGVSVRCVRLKK